MYTACDPFSKLQLCFPVFLVTASPYKLAVVAWMFLNVGLVIVLFAMLEF